MNFFFISVVENCIKNLLQRGGRDKGADISMEVWPYADFCLAGESGPAGVICTMMDGPYRLPCRTVPTALVEAAQLQASII